MPNYKKTIHELARISSGVVPVRRIRPPELSEEDVIEWLHDQPRDRVRRVIDAGIAVISSRPSR